MPVEVDELNFNIAFFFSFNEYATEYTRFFLRKVLEDRIIKITLVFPYRFKANYCIKCPF
jgi:hypothetical protein